MERSEAIASALNSLVGAAAAEVAVVVLAALVVVRERETGLNELQKYPPESLLHQSLPSPSHSSVHGGCDRKQVTACTNSPQNHP